MQFTVYKLSISETRLCTSHRCSTHTNKLVELNPRLRQGSTQMGAGEGRRAPFGPKSPEKMGSFKLVFPLICNKKKSRYLDFKLLPLGKKVQFHFDSPSDESWQRPCNHYTKECLMQPNMYVLVPRHCFWQEIWTGKNQNILSNIHHISSHHDEFIHKIPGLSNDNLKCTKQTEVSPSTYFPNTVISFWNLRTCYVIIGS